MFKVKDSDLRKRQLVLYSKRGSELLEKIRYKSKETKGSY